MAFLLCLFMNTTHVTAVSLPEPVLRPNDGLLALPLKNIIICLDHWYHTIVYKLPPKPTAEFYEQLALTIPTGLRIPRRTASLRFLSDTPELVTMNADSKCVTNITQLHNQTFIQDCPPYTLLQRIPYMYKYKNYLWCAVVGLQILSSL